MKDPNAALREKWRGDDLYAKHQLQRVVAQREGDSTHVQPKLLHRD